MKVMVFDFETTDLTGYAVEFAGLIIENIEEKPRLGRVYACGLNPQAPVNDYVAHTFQISEEKLKKQKTFREHWDSIFSLFKEADLIIAHNISFDYKVLIRELDRLGIILADNISAKFYDYNSFCTCKDTTSLYCKYPKLEQFVFDMKVPQEKAERLYRKCLFSTGYNPIDIRKKNILYHNALYDTVFLSYAVVNLFRKYDNIKRIAIRRVKNPHIVALFPDFS